MHPTLSPPLAVLVVKNNLTVATYCVAALVLVSAEPAWAGVYSYECSSLPANAGWTQINAFCGAQEWTKAGLLYQQVPLCDEFPGQGAQFDYTTTIENLAGATSWFVEWRVITTGISEELIYTAPAHLVAFDGNGHGYHFSIADDRVRFIRDFSFPVLYFDIEPGTWHTFRVEIFGENLSDTYLVYIDGAVVDGGQAEGPFFNPPWQAGVNFRAKAKLVPSVTTWDYIRWGPIPGDFDFNGDGAVDGVDFYFMHECLSDPQGAGSWVGCAWADADGSGWVDCADWAAFLDVWTAPENPPIVPECLCGMADLNGSNAVEASDLAMLLGSWGPNPASDADLTNDGMVNASDLALLLGAWGPCE